MKTTILPPVLQAIGLACVPVHDMPANGPGLAMRPVAAAVITLQTRADGHREIIALCMSDANASDAPLTRLLEQAFVPEASTLISPEDRAVLSIEAVARRTWSEPRLAAICAGRGVIDPAAVCGSRAGEERALCRRLQVPASLIGPGEIERAWSRKTPEPAMDIALSTAVARLMLWSHGASFIAGEPEAFFETLLPLREWMRGEEDEWPSLRQAAASRVMSWAASYAATYRRYRSAREEDDGVSWASFPAIS